MLLYFIPWKITAVKTLEIYFGLFSFTTLRGSVGHAGRWEGHALYKGMQISQTDEEEHVKDVKNFLCVVQTEILNASFTFWLLTYSDQFHMFWTHIFWTVLSFYSETASHYSTCWIHKNQIKKGRKTKSWQGLELSQLQKCTDFYKDVQPWWSRWSGYLKH